MSSPFLIGLYAIVLFQLLLLSVFLIVAKREKQLSNRILAAFFFWLAINITDGVLSYSSFYREHVALAHVEDGFIFLLGPLLYFYTLSVVYKQFNFAWRDALHLVPFLLTTVSFQIYYHAQPEEFQELIQGAIVKQDLPFEFYFTVALVYLHVAVYIVYALLSVANYRKLIRNQFSAVSKINLDWLVFMLISVSVILMLSVGFTFLPALGWRDLINQSLAFSFIAIITFTSLIFWKAWRQPQLFRGVEGGESRYQSSTLSHDEKEQIANRLRLCMAEQKPFLNPDLSIDQLSDLVKTTTRKTSQVINETFQQNYFDFVNSYRIEEAQKLMMTSNDDRITVLEIMYQCGFNSKSSFNAIFRSKTGQTPSQFRKSKRANGR